MELRTGQRQPWGERSLRLDLPATSLKLTGLSAAQFASLSSDFPGFIARMGPDANRPALHCGVYRLPRPLAVSADILTRDGQYAPRKIRRLDQIEITGTNFAARIGPSGSVASASLGVAEEHELAQANVIENFLRVLTAHRALGRGGVVLHSAGLVFGRRAFIFAGRSGAGKTTLTRKGHEKGARVLSDDINLLLPCAGGYEAHAVPFTGEFGRSLAPTDSRAAYVVAGLVLLTQRDRLQTKPVTGSVAVARLLTGCPFVNTDTDESAALFDAVTGLVARVPVIGLGCRRDDDIEHIMNAVTTEIENAQANG